MKIHSPRESYLWLKALWLHRRSQRISRAELEAMQRAKFRRLVLHAQQHSPFYRRVMQERGLDPRHCTPGDFPIITKHDVVEHFDEIVTDRALNRRRVADFLAHSTDPEERLDGRFHVLHTSGTSGSMGYFVFSHENWITGCAQVMRATHLRFRRRVAYIGATRGHFAGVSMMLAGNDGTNRLFYNVRPLDVNRPLPRIVQELNAFQPQAISGYARVLKVLAEAQERGELHIAPQEIGSGGEPLLPDAKAHVERVFQVPVKNGYASSEHLYMAMPLPGAEGMHLLEDDLIFELGANHTCVTNLFNDVMPLIRYRMDDVLIPETAGESPYPFQRVKEVVGRREDTLVFTNEHGEEDFIHPIVIVELVVPGLSAWQIVLESKTAFRFRASYDPALDESGRAATRQRLRQRLDGILAEKEMRNVRYEIEAVDSLAIDPQSGKFRLVTHAEPRRPLAAPELELMSANGTGAHS